MSSDREIPWRRILAEGAAIVFSILLAFGIQAWWEDRGDRAEEFRLLEALRDELVANDLIIEESLRFQKAMTVVSKSLLQAHADRQELSDEELDKMLGGLVWSNTTAFRTGVATGLVQSGKLSLIQVESLRNQIASIPAEQGRVIRTEEAQNTTYTFALMPFLFKNAAVPQLSNAQPTSPGTGESPQPPLPIRQPRSHQNLMESEEFIGIVTEMYWEQNDIITRLTEYQTFAAKLMAKIDATLVEMNQ